ncbi:hypothetical protein B0H14DRAFT_2655058 [Mycena olivaceomarginata]|nr:hypothetical protein B0H14DRAFT_2655058 [Mycena olivaceomarginata]
MVTRWRAQGMTINNKAYKDAPRCAQADTFRALVQINPTGVETKCPEHASSRKGTKTTSGSHTNSLSSSFIVGIHEHRHGGRKIVSLLLTASDIGFERCDSKDVSLCRDTIRHDLPQYSVGIKGALNIIEPINNSQTVMRNWRLVLCTIHVLLANFGDEDGSTALIGYLTTVQRYTPQELCANNTEPGWCGHFDNFYPVLCPVLAPPLYMLVLYARIIG